MTGQEGIEWQSLVIGVTRVSGVPKEIEDEVPRKCGNTPECTRLIDPFSLRQAVGLGSKEWVGKRESGLMTGIVISGGPDPFAAIPTCRAAGIVSLLDPVARHTDELFARY